MPYAMVKDAKAAAATAAANGGKIINGPMEVPGGDWIAQGMDPQGAMFSVHSLKPAAKAAPAQKAAPAKKAAAAKKKANRAPKKAAAKKAKARPVKRSKPAKKKAAKKKAAKKKAAKRKK